MGSYPTQEAHCIESSNIGYLHLIDHDVSKTYYYRLHSLLTEYEERMWGHDLKNELPGNNVQHSTWSFKVLTYNNRVSTKQLQSLANSQPITKSEYIPSKVAQNSLFLPEEELFDLSYH